MNFGRIIAKVGFALKKSGPKILTYTGVGLGVGCAVATGVQTAKFVKDIEPEKEILSRMPPKASRSPVEREEASKAKRSIAKKATRRYALPVGLGVGSAACVIGGHNVLNKENAALASAYIALNESYKQYKAAAPLPEEPEETVVDENSGEQIVIPAKQKSWHLDQFSRLIDCGNEDIWSPDPHVTLLTLKRIQCYLNDKLHSNDTVFLNEVYDELGLPRTIEGQYFGWYYIKGEHESYIDFGIFDKDNDAARRFVQGAEEAIWLTFNVDGPIIQLFPSTK